MAQDASTETIEHPAETRVVHHEAVTETRTVVDQEARTETVIDVPAYDETVFDHWQRYSWTGGPHGSDDAPAFPGANWQANVQGDPHGIGVAGAYYRANGNSGNGDWFYLEAVTKVVHHAAVTHDVHHPAVTHDEIIVVQDAYNETVVDKEAWTQVVEHDAVVCPTPTSKTTQVLPNTGGPSALAGGLGFVLVAAGYLLLRRRATD